MSSALRIAVMIESDGPGGAERMVLDLAKGLEGRGHSVLAVGRALGSGWLRTRFEALGIPYAGYHLRHVVDPGTVIELRAILKRHRTQVVHSHEFTLAFYGALAARLAGARHVITMHGGRGFAAVTRRRLALRVAHALSAATVSVSEAARQHLAAAIGVSYKSILVVPNGVDFHQGSGEGLRRLLRVPIGGQLIVSVGNLYPVKGHQHLIEAIHILGREGSSPPLVLAIAGRGAEETRLKALAKELGVQERVCLLGYREDVPDILAAADVFALPSLSEGLPMALLEAMHARKAIVASNVGGIPEVVRHGREALLTRPGHSQSVADALGAVARDSRLREHLAKNAAERARAFYTAEVMTAHYERLYREVLREW